MEYEFYAQTSEGFRFSTGQRVATVNIYRRKQGSFGSWGTKVGTIVADDLPSVLRDVAKSVETFGSLEALVEEIEKKSV